MSVLEIAMKAKKAAGLLARTHTEQKNIAINKIADSLIDQQTLILEENKKDVESAFKAGIGDAMIDRLELNPKRINQMADDLRMVSKLPDPVGEKFEESILENGIHLRKQRVPLGVLGVIYESRPNVTIDVAALAIKTGNAAILRGGKETIFTNLALVSVIADALKVANLPPEAIQYIRDTDRDRILELLKLDKYVDMIIPRGGSGLHDFCREHSRIPVMTGGMGICHLFVDETADQLGSLRIIHNAKTQRPSVCNSLDAVLVHRTIAKEFLPKIVEYLGKDGVTFKADPSSFEIIGNNPKVTLAEIDDFDTEWLSLVLSIKVVDDLDEAIEHITLHSTHHSDGILTKNTSNADHFVSVVDSAAVYVNASTRFTDGSEFGLGAEVAVSTQRLHARGPMGLRELTTYKWVAYGDWNIRP